MFYSSHKTFVETRFSAFSTFSVVAQLLEDCQFPCSPIGQSVEGRAIHCIKVGNGPVRIMLWSQMHGNESTATGAIFDLLRFFSAKNPVCQDQRSLILERLTLYFIPMLNPDGAERWQRNNALDIDLNRDALRLTSPESQILWKAQQDIAPHFAFNLHDQESYYSTGAHIPATISLLAPPIDDQNTWSPTREKAGQLVCSIYQKLQEYIPGGVGRWNDDYEPRAFGEQFQIANRSTILIEAGSYPNDPQRNKARQLTYVALLHALDQIATNRLPESIDAYQTIPRNTKGMLFDKINRNKEFTTAHYVYRTDEGLRYEVSKKDGVVQSELKVVEIGDLSNYYEIDK